MSGKHVLARGVEVNIQNSSFKNILLLHEMLELLVAKCFTTKNIIDLKIHIKMKENLISKTVTRAKPCMVGICLQPEHLVGGSWRINSRGQF